MEKIKRIKDERNQKFIYANNKKLNQIKSK